MAFKSEEDGYWQYAVVEILRFERFRVHAAVRSVLTSPPATANFNGRDQILLLNGDNQVYDNEVSRDGTRISYPLSDCPTTSRRQRSVVKRALAKNATRSARRIVVAIGGAAKKLKARAPIGPSKRIAKDKTSHNKRQAMKRDSHLLRLLR